VCLCLYVESVCASTCLTCVTVYVSVSVSLCVSLYVSMFICVRAYMRVRVCVCRLVLSYRTYVGNQSIHPCFLCVTSIISPVLISQVFFCISSPNLEFSNTLVLFSYILEGRKEIMVLYIRNFQNGTRSFKMEHNNQPPTFIK
jgi:hypothetical protein